VVPEHKVQFTVDPAIQKAIDTIPGFAERPDIIRARAFPKRFYEVLSGGLPIDDVAPMPSRTRSIVAQHFASADSLHFSLLPQPQDPDCHIMVVGLHAYGKTPYALILHFRNGEVLPVLNCMN
jgi:hypothetical protein